MPNNNHEPKKTVTGTDVEKVKKANNVGTEFAEETDVQSVKRENAKSEARKHK